MMMYIRPFGQVGNTVSLTGAGVVAVTRPGIGTQSIRIVNSGENIAFLTFGKNASVTSSPTTGMPMLAGTIETFLLPNDITHIAVAYSAGTGTDVVYFTTGESA